MTREIELKVPLTCEQFDRIEKILTQKEQLSSINICGLLHILKSDEYFSRYHTHEKRIKNNELRVIRIRTENDGRGEKSFFCIKRKTIENGVEFNSEKETFVEDADVLRAFFEASGFIKWFEKKKDAIGVLCSLDSSGFAPHRLALSSKINGWDFDVFKSRHVMIWQKYFSQSSLFMQARTQERSVAVARTHGIFLSFSSLRKSSAPSLS